MQYAINYVLGRDTHTLVVEAPDSDDAYTVARDNLVKRHLFSASLQGSCRPATQADIDSAAIAIWNLDASTLGEMSRAKMVLEIAGLLEFSGSPVASWRVTAAGKAAGLIERAC